MNKRTYNKKDMPILREKRAYNKPKEVYEIIEKPKKKKRKSYLD